MTNLKIVLKLLTQSSVIVALMLFSLRALALEVESVRLWPAPDNTRVVFDLSQAGEYKAFTMPGPDHRLVIDFQQSSSMAAKLSSLDLRNTPIKKIRTGTQSGNRLRIVLDLKEGLNTEHFMLPAIGDKQDRLVVDLDYSQQKITSAPVTISEPNPGGRRDIVIVIDPGHGGEDPGSIGASRIYEKNVALDISKRLKKLVDAQPGFRAEMTRTGDYGMELDQRRRIAREQRADLFVSIHADAFTKRNVRGASVYAWNKDGSLSKNEIDRYLQQREKEANLIGGFEDISIKDMDDTVAQTLMDLAIVASLTSSLEAGADILGSMGSVAKLHDASVRQAQFVVLRIPDVPSLLVETGFISNPTDEKQLNSSSYQQKLANSVFSGIKKYFNKKPPDGSYVAWAKKNGQSVSEHVIKRGESLSLIAYRYKVSVSDIMLANGMSTDRIMVGQSLKIPSI